MQSELQLANNAFEAAFTVWQNNPAVIAHKRKITLVIIGYLLIVCYCAC